MSRRPVIPRKQAESDIDSAFEHYLTEAGGEVAVAFVDALERATVQISRNPAAGSPRYALELELPGLRHWRIKGFPYMIFYVAHDRHIEIWRVLHVHRDVPGWLEDPDE